MKRIFFSIIISIVAGILYCAPVHALTISPGKISLTASAGQTSITDVVLYNETKNDLLVAMSAETFAPDPNRGGSPKFISKTNDLADWIHTPETSFLLQKGERKSVPISINIPLNTSAGGHYAAVFFEGKTRGAVDSQVGISSQVGVLIFLTVNGEIIEQARIIDFKKEDGNFKISIENTGNTHIAPRGKLNIKNNLGLTLKETEINKERKFVLPRSVRDFKVPVEAQNLFERIWINLASIFGQYKVELRLDNFSEKSIEYWSTPWTSGIVFVLIIILIYIAKRRKTIL